MSTFQPFELLEHNAKAHPDAPAIISQQARLSFAELSDTALRFASLLRERGIKPGQLVGLRLPTTLDLGMSMALFHEAAVGGSIAPDVGPAGRAQFDWIISMSPDPAVPAERQIVISQALLNRAALLPPATDRKHYATPQALCRVSFSSGTTGEPKMIPWSVECLRDRAIDRKSQWMLGQPYLCLLGLSTGLGFMTALANLSSAEPFFDAGSFQKLLPVIKRFGVRCLVGSPTQLLLLVRESIESGETPQFETVMSAGSNLPDATASQLTARFGAQVVSTYASSEAGSVAVRYGPDQGARHGASVTHAGTILPDVEVRILDENGAALEEGEIGQVAIGRPLQPREYLNDAVATKKSFRDGLFLPGDTGFVLGDELFLTGRTSELIDAGGVKVNPTSIDAAALECDGVRDAAAFPRTDEATGLTSIALAVVGDYEPRALATQLRKRFGEAGPSFIVKVSEIPRNHMGKVNRSSLASSVGRPGP